MPDFERDIRPVFDAKCIACHACYDAPCQLKLEDPEGVIRGATEKAVYNGTRIRDMEPTRLHVDALTEAEWRNKGFFSVLENLVESRGHAATAYSLMAGMIDLGREHPVVPNEPLTEDYTIGIYREDECPRPEEFAEYKKQHPKLGMPYGVTGLTDGEYRLLSDWLANGAPVKPMASSLAPVVADQVARWEKFFNRPDKRHQLVARYLYEHLFLAHLYFRGDKTNQYFRVVRSRTRAPEAIVPVATVKPYGDPEGEFFYRLRPQTNTIVHKTHIIYELSDTRMARFQELFLSGEWELETLPGYSYEFASNPFLTFSAIPARSRYQFMLDNAEYFVRTFIRGPVCRGQIATDVIRDQFWIMFEDPDYEQYINNSGYRRKVTDLLGLPGEDSDLLALGPAWFKYSGKRNKYLERRQKQYGRSYPGGPTVAHVWDGDGHNDNAFLTIFRHHDSASVLKGWQGALPLTLWLMDYPLFERTYYELVVGFNVFGSVSHQAQTRLYFDLIRNGGETNFLRLVPASERGKIYDDWYKYSGLIKKLITYHDLDVKTPSGLTVSPGIDTKLQVVEQIWRANRDLIKNRSLDVCRDPVCLRVDSAHEDLIDSQLAELASGRAKDIPGILQLPNVSFLRVDLKRGGFKVYTLLRNRAHSNVAFILGEELRYEPEKDSVTIMKGPVGSYPNYIFRVSQSQVSDFVDDVANMKRTKDRDLVVERWGVRRSSPDFWKVFHSFSDYLKASKPRQSGVYDLNRYHGW
ncbi:MAG: fatty acid cis/trans isomerase [Ketobacteraceae bacterium]|nr:fatty acid cis/trans isomerase [Ketobacteraceae bacterium]